MKKALCVVFFAIVLILILGRDQDTTLGPGIYAPDDPVQISSNAPSFEYNGYTITPLAEFWIQAKVLSKKKYSTGREADVSPVDLALGWGRMSDESVLDELKIWQSNRWYRWRTDDFPIPRQEIESHSGNMHIIPASDIILSILNTVRKGDIVEFSGKLVRVDADDGWHWVSSLRRSDVGDHSCEVVWVEEIMIHDISHHDD